MKMSPRISEYRRGIHRILAAIAITLMIILMSFTALPVAAADESSTPVRSVTLVAPEIQSGENMVRIGEIKYIKYPIKLVGLEGLSFSSMNFTVEYDPALLTLYNTNIGLGQSYAYVPDGAAGTSQKVNFEVKFPEAGKISSAVSAASGMNFKDGIVLILYFFPVDQTQHGQSTDITLGDFSANLLTEDTVAGEGNYTLSYRSGSLKLTAERMYISGEPGTSPEPQLPPGKGTPEKPKSTEGYLRVILNFIIALVIVIIFLIACYTGIKAVRRKLKITGRLKLTKEKDPSEQQNNQDKPESDRP